MRDRFNIILQRGQPGSPLTIGKKHHSQYAIQEFQSYGFYTSITYAKWDLDSQATNDMERLYLEKCGESELQKAGECFSLAGCYELAADVYAKGNFFSECLKKEEKKVDKIEQEFLENCALHHHEHKDNRSMMKFVKAFQSIYLMRNFLKSLNCLGELLLLEEELGNFLEAANIAKLRGEILHEADLLGKAGNFREASMLFLIYVLYNSLWIPGSIGWPLKQFTQKLEILAKAKSFAKNELDSFYSFVCTEADILSNEQSDLSITNKYLNASQRHNSVGGEIISARKILDAHLQSNSSKYVWMDYFVFDLTNHSEQMISRNQISVETLVYFWTFWKDKIVNIFKYLKCVDTQDVNEYRRYGDFCLNYLGVRKQFHNLNAIYVLLNSDAYWVQELDSRLLRQNGNLVYIDVRHFVSTARSYWCSELLCVGMKVLDNLETLYKLSFKNPNSMFCQSRCLTYIYEIGGNHWQRNMFSLRGTEVSRNLLKQVIIENISLKGLMGFYGNTPWMTFIQILCGNMGSEFPQGTLPDNISESPRELSILLNFHKALKDTYNANWKEIDYVSPGCFLYLIERLLILASYFKGYFITSKSSFAEWFIYQEHHKVKAGAVEVEATNPCSEVLSSVSYDQDGCKFAPSNFALVADQEDLNNMNGSKLQVWEIFEGLNSLKHGKNPRISLSNAQIIKVDVEKSIHLVTTVMNEHLENAIVEENLLEEVASMLDELKQILLHWIEPELGNNMSTIGELSQRLLSRRPNVEPILSQLFLQPGTNLVVETSDGLSIEQCDVKDSNSKAKENSRAVEVEATNPCSEVLSSVSYDQDGCKFAPSNFALVADQEDLNNMNGSKLQVWEIFEALNSLKHGKNPRISLSNAQIIKVDVEKSIHLVTTVMNEHLENAIVEENLLEEVASMLDELKQISAALDVSEPELGNNMSTIGELSQRLLSRRPNVEPILSQLFLQPGTNLVVETSDGLSIEQCDVKDSNSKAKENSSAVEVEATNPCSEVLSSVSYDQDGCKFAPSNFALVADQEDLNNMNGSKLQVWEIFEALNSLKHGKNPRISLSNAQIIKVDVEKSIHLVTTVMNEHLENAIVEENLLEEVASMLDELKQISAALDVSEPELGNNMSTIGELSQRLLSRRPNVEPILSQLFLQPGTNLVVESSDGLSIEQCDVKDSNSKAKENSSAVEVETVNPCSEVLSSVSYDQDGCVRVPHDGVRCHRASVVLRAAVPLPIYVRHALRVAVGRWLVAARAARLHLLQLFGPVVMGSRLLVADRGGGPVVSR
uniref:Uncharacterized protein n=1 Tax=Fagus sylvatica TaxID=28930 RepID=A0A2N9IGF5_FAGSY